MKRNFSILVLSLILIFNLIPSNIALAKTNDTVNDVIYNYLDNSLSIKRDLKITKNDSIDKNSKLYEYNKLLSQTTLDWYNGIGQQLSWYNIDLKINSVEYQEDLIKVNATSIINCQYKDVDFDTKYSENHIFYIKDKNNTLTIEKDIFEQYMNAIEVENIINSTSSYDSYISKKISDQKIKNINIANDIKLSKNTSFNIQNKASLNPYILYNRNGAASYAINNAFGAEDYANNDCTNFVSKALLWGGLTTDSTWYKGSYAWIRVINLRDYLISSGRAKQYSSTSYADLGDVIQLYNKNKQTWSHSVIVTFKGSGTVYVSAHSYPAKNKDFRDYYPNTSYYSNYRVLHIN